MPPATQLLIVANTVGFLATMGLGDALLGPLALWPPGPGFMPWQPVSYAFVHGGLTHLLLNMFALYMFGSDLERVWGQRRYLTYYGICVARELFRQGRQQARPAFQQDHARPARVDAPELAGQGVWRAISAIVPAISTPVGPPAARIRWS